MAVSTEQRPTIGPASRPASSSSLRPIAVAAYRQAASLLLRGDRLECPCCGGTFRRFLTHGVEARRDAECPRCGSLERHRLMWSYLRERTNLFTDPLSVLHFAPERSFMRLFRALPNLRYTTADISSPLADLHFDICDNPFPDHSFDVVICSHVLEHVPDDRQAMSELYRVMRPGGWGIIQVPMSHRRQHTIEDWSITSEKKRVDAFGQKDHVRDYGLDYYDRLRDAGFEVSQDLYARELPDALVQRRRLPSDEIICVARKPAREVVPV